MWDFQGVAGLRNPISRKTWGLRFIIKRKTIKRGISSIVEVRLPQTQNSEFPLCKRATQVSVLHKRNSSFFYKSKTPNTKPRVVTLQNFTKNVGLKSGLCFAKMKLELFFSKAKLQTQNLEILPCKSETQVCVLQN